MMNTRNVTIETVPTWVEARKVLFSRIRPLGRRILWRGHKPDCIGVRTLSPEEGRGYAWSEFDAEHRLIQSGLIRLKPVTTSPHADPREN